MHTDLYRKQGRRYVPVAQYDPENVDSLPEGSHLIICKPGSRSRQFHVDPNHVALIAAARTAQDAMCEAIVQASVLRPRKGKLTCRQKVAWGEFLEAMGSDAHGVYYDSAHDVAAAGVRALTEEAERLMENEAVQRAYDQFLLMCKLANSQIDKNK